MNIDYNDLKIDLPDKNKKQIYVYASMPCPLKVPFGQMIKPFVKKWNADPARTPLYCPLDTDCSTENLRDAILEAQTEDDLPDVFVSTAFDIFFSRDFRREFIENGIYGPFPDSFYAEDYSENIIEASGKFKCGFLGFSSWGIVEDLTYTKPHPSPDSWKDLVLPEYRDLISMHGCHGHAGSFSTLLSLEKTGGDEMLRKLAGNIYKVEHFSKLINEIGTLSKKKTPFYILPYVAITNIPTSKKIKVLSLKGNTVTPMMCLVKQSKIKECEEVLRFFTGTACKNVFSKGAYFQPGEISHIENYRFEDLEKLSTEYYEEASQITVKFIEMLGDKME